MLSIRLNKEGKEVPSVIDSGYSHTQNDFSNWRDKYPHLVNDERGWEYPRTPTTRLSQTSLGKPTCALEQKPGIFTPTPATLREHNQDELNMFLVRMNRFSPGDFITFSAYPSMGPMVSYTSMTFILSVDRLIEQCVWNDKESDPKPFLVLDLSPLHPNSKIEPTARYINCLYSRHITADERRNLITNNVLLPNYIQQAQESLKAGTLKIRG